MCFTSLFQDGNKPWICGSWGPTIDWTSFLIFALDSNLSINEYIVYFVYFYLLAYGILTVVMMHFFLPGFAWVVCYHIPTTPSLKLRTTPKYLRPIGYTLLAQAAFHLALWHAILVYVLRYIILNKIHNDYINIYILQNNQSVLYRYHNYPSQIMLFIGLNSITHKFLLFI